MIQKHLNDTYIRVDPLVSTVRIYKFPIDPSIPLCNVKDHYYKSFPIAFLDNGVARISGVVEVPTRKEMAEFFKYLKEHGSHTVEWRHNDKTVSVKI